MSGRRQKVPGGRDRQINVRVTDAERAKIAQRATSLGLSAGAYLAEAGLADGGDSPADRIRRREAVDAALSVRAQLAWIGNNLNQIAHVANASGEIYGPQLEAVLARVLEVVAVTDDSVGELRRS